jgi:hypothetical protein
VPSGLTPVWSWCPPRWKRINRRCRGRFTTHQTSLPWDVSYPPGAVSPQGPRRNAHIEPVAAAVPPHAVQEQPTDLATGRPAWSPASPSRPGAPIARSFPASMARLAGRGRRSPRARFGNAGGPTTFMDAGYGAKVARHWGDKSPWPVPFYVVTHIRFTPADDRSGFIARPPGHRSSAAEDRCPEAVVATDVPRQPPAPGPS